ncbi:alpha/beta hydrolase [Sphingomonas sp. CL5.1]|uniref:alpha/beta fold hydrolase n=1 Tax=Sphingomonas sp. CL5.1 TaxID=2653203 RepID=UPI0015827F59|nr:alpha/beta hydrolase [Sphingomonas sp. CL5.1]QKS01147.1 alpha/beta hydrolase [Sphingomonas sp. CL5.1]
MSIWIDFLGAEIRYVDTPTFGRVRIAEAGRDNPEALFLMHGIGGHIEAYSKNVVTLGKHFHVIAFDFVGHGLSEKKTDIEYPPQNYAEQLKELMDVLGIGKAHISGESLGGMVAAHFAIKYPERTMRVILNTTGGIPIASEKGRQDLIDLANLTQANVGKPPSFESILGRMRWLIYEGNWDLLTEELVESRLAIYTQPDFQKSAPLVFARLNKAKDGDTMPDMVDLERIEAETLLLWTTHNPIHDVAAAELALPRLRKGKMYVMRKDCGHWPQYESPDEFDAIVVKYLNTGDV